MLTIHSALTGVTVLAQDGGHHVVNELPVPTWVFGWGVFLVFLFCLLVTLSMRSVGRRLDVPSTEVAHGGSHGQHGSHGRRTGH